MAKRGNSEGSITQLSDGRWQARVSLPDGRRKAYYGKTRKEARDKLTEALASQRQGLPLPNERATVALFLASWLDQSVRPRLAPNSVAGYEVNIRRHIIPAIGKLSLAKLAPQDVQKMLNDLRARGLSDRTVQYVHATLRAALSQALRWSVVARNVAKLVDPVKVDRPKVHPLSPEEAQRVLEAVRGERLEAVYAVALAMGLRISEALGLQWCDVDFVAQEMRIRTQIQRVSGQWQLRPIKTVNGNRTIGLPAVAVDALRAHRVRQLEEQLSALDWKGSPFDLVFTTGVGTPLDRHNVWRYFARALKRAGLPHIRQHDLRHACASLLYAQGVDLGTISEILGHSGIQITKDLYAHVLPSLRRSAAERMNAALTGGV